MTEKTETVSTLDNMTLEQLLAKAKAENHPWLPAIGIFEEGAVFDEWQQAIAEYRHSVDEDPNLRWYYA